MPENNTKFNSFKIESKNGKPDCIHEIDQFYWYNDGAPKKWDRHDRQYKKQALSAISFALPHRGGTAQSVVVVSDSEYTLEVYMCAYTGQTLTTKKVKSVTLATPTEDFFKFIPTERPKHINLNTLFTTEIKPFLKGSDPTGGPYPFDCYRTYKMFLSRCDDYVEAVADVREPDEERPKMTFCINLVRDGKSENILTLKNSKVSWYSDDLENMIAKARKEKALV